jgi:hypothetical protein
MKLISAAFFLIAFSAFIFGQDSDKPQPDRWRGLILEESAAEDAMKGLGRPKSDKQDKILSLKKDWLSKDSQKTNLRVLHYENLETFSDVKLVFNDRNKLVIIHLEPKKLTAQSAAGAYQNLELRLANTVLTPSDFNKPQDNEKPFKFGAWYQLVGVTDKTFVFMGVGNGVGSVGSTMFSGMGRSDRSLPGDVKMIQLVSRTLENRDGVDVLK